MITYEEFVQQNTEAGKLYGLNFDRDCSNFKGIYPDIFENYVEYIDVAQKATELKQIRISGVGSAEYYRSVTEFIQHCSENVKVINSLIGEATKKEFLEAEEIINQIISEIDSNWSIKQKLAYIHFKIGEKISYLADFKSKDIPYISQKPTELQNARNIWKSILRGESVCNGIVGIERTILSRMGINTQVLESDTDTRTHTFLLTETEEGNIITDPTWDLSNTLYKSKPMFFGVTYEYLRRQDGAFSNAHRLKTPPENVKEISDEELREIFYSIGVIEEDRRFPFPIMHRVEDIEAQRFDSLEQKIDAFLRVITQEFAQEATHLPETRSLIEDIVSSFGISRDEISSKFIYSTDDEDCETPHLVFHFNTEEMKGKVKLLNLEQMEFQDIDIIQLDLNYKQHNFRTDRPFWKRYLPDDITLEQGTKEKE